MKKQLNKKFQIFKIYFNKLCNKIPVYYINKNKSSKILKCKII